MSNRLRIGVAGTFSGPRSYYGEMLRNIVEEFLNEEIEVYYLDDAATVDKAVWVAKKFVDMNVHIVIGHFNGECSIAVKDIYVQNKILFINPASTHTQLTTSNDGVFRICSDDYSQARKINELALTLGLSNIIVVKDGSDYSSNIHQYLKLMSPTYNHSLLSEKFIFRNPFDFNIIYLGSHYHSANFLKMLLEIGFDNSFITSDDSKIQEFIQISGVKTSKNIYVVGPSSYLDTSKLAIKLVNYVSRKNLNYESLILNLKNNPYVSFDNIGNLQEYSWKVWTIENEKFIQKE